MIPRQSRSPRPPARPGPGVLRAPRATLLVLLIATGTPVPGSAATSDPADAVAPLPAPRGDTLIVIDGAIDRTNVGDEAHFDLPMLEALPRTTFVTATLWDEGPQTFEGTRLSTLLERVGAASGHFLAVGEDDYRAEFADVDLERYPVVVAWRQNGATLTLRTLGPLRIVFPFDDHPELLTRLNRAMSVWQLVRMSVRP